MVEISGLDAESDILEECEDGELSRDIAKLYTYPNHNLIEKPITELKLKVTYKSKFYGGTYFFNLYPFFPIFIAFISPIWLWKDEQVQGYA